MILVQKHVGLSELRLAQRVALWREPVRPLPAVYGAEHGAEILHPPIARRLAERPRGLALLVGIMHGEDLRVGLLVLLNEITCVRIRAEATRVDAKHVDRRLAFDDPLGELPAGAASRGDAKRMAFVEPEVPHARRGADDRRAVGRVGDGAVVDLLDADLAEGGNARDRGFDVRARGDRDLREKARIRSPTTARRHSRPARLFRKAPTAGRPPPRACTRQNPIRVRPPFPASPAPCA